MKPTSEQARAIGRRDGSLLVRAGAGTGKTSVLVERFVAAAREDGADVASILAITFTEKAAAQLKTRVRQAFAQIGDRDRARDAERAWISTIHGFCARVLRTHALAAGLDPEFKVLDELESERLGKAAFEGALRDFLVDPPAPERVELLAAYGPDKLEAMVRTAHGWLRSRGEAPLLPSAAEPVATGELEALRGAARAAAAALGAETGKQVLKGVERMERCLKALERVEGEFGDRGAFHGLEAGGSAKALDRAEVSGYNDALAAWVRLCTAKETYGQRLLIGELLRLFGDHYAALKRARSGLDFEDLELGARDLLSGDEGLRRRYAERFSHVLVDEFQDTNPLQNDVLGLLEQDNLFRVGDERQSIYRFRHADVGVFQGHAEKAEGAGRLESLTVNFRSRPEVLDAIGMAFRSLWPEYEPLRPPEDDPPSPARVSPPVELLTVDASKPRWEERLPPDDQPFGGALRSATPWRAAEARLLAKRIDELTGPDRPYAYGDVVVLLRATTHMTFYERALEERGIPTHVLGGRGYWSQQQVADLRAYLAALANPLDELSLYSVLASPLAGASLDALAAIGIQARRLHRDLWWLLEEAVDGDGSEGLLDTLPEADRDRVSAFVGRFRAERAAAPRMSLETLIDRAVTDSGYDRTVLRMPAGDRRLANVRKLMRMAREFEADEGRDLRAFIDFLAERDLIQEREGQAPLEAEKLDAVRLMTIHRAKGLEFPVVCVADLGKLGRDDDGALRMSEGGEVGLKLASLGAGSVDSEELTAIKEEAKLAGEEEERRIFYVAVTRAREHLVLSGATDLDKLDEPRPLLEPMRWVWRSFAPGMPELGPEGEAVQEFEGREVRVRCQVLRPADVDVLLPDADRRPAAPPPEGNGAVPAGPPEAAAVAVPSALPVSRLSYSRLAAYRRCGYRFYLEQVLRLPAPEEERPEPVPPAGAGLPGLLRGSLVHELLEGLDFRTPAVPPEEAVAALLEARGAEPLPEHVADLRALVEAFTSSELSARLATAERVRPELPFAFTLAGLLVNGIVDVYAEEPGDGVLIVDYKSDPLDGREPAEIVAERYSTQRLVYGLAGLRTGAPRVEVAYSFLERPGEPLSVVFEAADEARLDTELTEVARGVLEGDFTPSDTPHRGLCAGCPGRPALCVHNEDMTLREAPA